ncbi:hypothetical protein LTR62_008412 [Meristemomyces frigidus]|uniref:Mannan endo-1,6-alpha-mannosidase n=1 Tax=Meristemomyces frigidus TaxID=1508187 RepID=A0AAN7T9M6_9PEZI|nr:hypothetical protein LTR62_008412 [Meristemomyces frigidus]
MHFPSTIGGICLAVTSLTHAINVDVNTTQSLTTAAKAVASRIVEIYSNTSTNIGLFPAPYYFWESGLTWDTLILYWALTGDSTYNDLVGEALLSQMGSNNDFMPANQTKNEGNDDQAFWALAAMTAAERGLPTPQEASANVTWIQRAQTVFDEQVARWDDQSCGGGLRWQIFPFNNGYDYKNALTNGNFAQLAARLGAFTGNATYTHWAMKTLQWSYDSGLISSSGAVYDGFSTTTNCSQANHIQWTASAGAYISAAASVMSATNAAPFWTTALNNLTSAIDLVFVQDGVLYESACAPGNYCSTDQLAFKSILLRALSMVQDLGTTDSTTNFNTTTPNSNNTSLAFITPLLRASAQAAAAACSGGTSGKDCGSDWTTANYDNSTGLGQELNALQAFLSNLPKKEVRNVNSTGGSMGTSGVSNGTGNGSSAGTSNGTQIYSSGAAGSLGVAIGMGVSLMFACALLL